MLVAIVSGIIAVLLAIAFLSVAFVVFTKRKNSSISTKLPVEPIATVGVASSLEPGGAHDAGVVADDDAIASPSIKGPADAMKSQMRGVGVFAAAVFGALGLRSFQMQVLNNSDYVSASQSNQYTTVYTPAPRGYIRDADGLALVSNRSSLTILADPDVINDNDTVMRLSAVLGIPAGVVRNRLQDTSQGVQSQRSVASDVRLRDIAFISEHSDAFPGVSVQTRTVRDYPYGSLAAHVLGYTGSVTQEDIDTTAAGRSLEMGDDIGQAGIEYMYDNLLAGDHGERKVVADANGNVVELVSETQPVKGSDVYLTIKGPVQYLADKTLADLIAPSGVLGSGTGTGGAAVVMDVRDGGIVALSSFPTFSPAEFVGGVSADTWEVYNSENSHTPMLNRVIGGTYPAASTYKAFTGLAALAYGYADTKKTWSCSGEWDGWNTGQVQKCWLDTGHGTLDFRGGIVNSCDTVFYDIGYHFYMDSPLAGANKISESAEQDYVAKFGFGKTSGIDLLGEAEGVVPTPAWKKSYFADYPEESQWRGGDSTNMSIGQGYVLTTPIQVAVGYAAIATGKLLKPHLFKEVRNDSGDVALSYNAPEASVLDVPEENLAIVRDALNGVATDNSSIANCFNENGIDPATVACKTGTGEVANQDDYAWFACYAPYDDPKYVVACVVEQGGGGSATAAPIGAKLLAAALNYDEGELSEMGTISGYSGVSVEYAGGSSGRTD